MEQQEIKPSREPPKPNNDEDIINKLKDLNNTITAKQHQDTSTFKKIVSPYIENENIYVNNIYELNYLVKHLKSIDKNLSIKQVKNLFNSEIGPIIKSACKKVYLKLQSISSIKYNIKHPKNGLKKIMGIKSFDEILLLENLKILLSDVKLHIAKSLSVIDIKKMLFNIYKHNDFSMLINLLKISETLFPLLIMFIASVI